MWRRRRVRRGVFALAVMIVASVGVLPAAANAQGARPDIGPARPATDSASAVRAATPATELATPATSGSWSAVMDWGLQAKHMASLPTGDVLVWSTGSNASVWNPASGTFSAAPALFGDLHCAGESMLADGRVIVVGGQNGATHNGTSVTSIFDPSTGAWTQGADMAYLRWYATSTTLADGRVLATSGDAPDGSRATIPEIYDPVANTWTKLTSAPRSQSLYPLMFVLPDKRVFEAGPGSATAILDLAGTPSWVPGPTNAWSTNGYSESAVMYAPGRILRVGGGDPAINRAAVIDMTAANPAWREVAPMAFARRRMNLTILADGTVLAIGGTKAADDAAQAVLAAEIWNPATETWSTVDAMAEPRMYHSSAVLLPDGRIVTGGGEAAGRLRAQIYSPPYLFQGARPVIQAAPTVAGYGGTFSVTTPDVASITSVALIRLNAATHAFDENQRYVPLPFVPSGNHLTVTAPAGGGYAPPGMYQLVIKNAAGIPSVASMIRIDSGTNLQPGTVTGTIVDAGTGLPIAGAGVTVGGIPTTSAGDGTYTVAGVAAGERTIAVVAAGYAAASRSQSIVGGGTYQVDFALSAPGALGGHVTDAGTGLALAGATITYPGGEATTDATGAYLVTGLSSGSVQVAASAAGHVSVEQTTSVGAGGTTTLDFALPEAATFITGSVTDVTTGQPLVGAAISIPGGGATVTDGLGRYRVDVGPGTYTVTASASGHVSQSHDAIVSAGTYAVSDFALATPPPAATTLSFIATADAELSQTSPTKNAGTASSFRIRAGTPSSPSTYVDYLKFTVSGLAGQTPSGVKLRLYNTDASDDGGSVVAAGNGWTETGITWANAPATTGSALGAAGPVSVSQWADIALTPAAIPADGTYTFALISHSSNSSYYQSRTGANKPTLELTIGSGPPPPPPPPPPPTGPTAAFTATPTSGPAPLAVTVTDGSTGAPTSWSWDFGDGTTSTLAAPATHSYTSPGTYTLRLTVANTGGSSSATRTVTVAAAPPPPPPASRIASMTFEAGRLVDPTTGATKVSGTATLVTAAPLVGVDSAGISSSTAYLERSWTANDDVYVSAVIRFAARPTGAVRVLQISNAGTTVGNLQLQPDGALRLRKDSTTIGVDSAPLSAGVAYRIAIHQKRGTGADAVLEGFVAPLGSGLGTPFASRSNLTWTTAADRLRIGATSGAALDVVIDDVFVDTSSLPVTLAAVTLPASPARLPALASVAARYVCLLT